MRGTLVRDNSLTPKQVRWSARSYTYKYKYIHVYTNTIYIYILLFARTYVWWHTSLYTSTNISYCVHDKFDDMHYIHIQNTYSGALKLQCFLCLHNKGQTWLFWTWKDNNIFFLVNKNALILKNYIAMSNSKSKATLNTIFNVVVVSNQIDKSTSTLHSISKALMLEEWEVGLYRVIPCHT